MDSRRIRKAAASQWTDHGCHLWTNDEANEWHGINLLAKSKVDRKCSTNKKKSYHKKILLKIKITKKSYHKCWAVLRAPTKSAAEGKSRVISGTGRELPVRTSGRLCPDDIVSLQNTRPQHRNVIVILRFPRGKMFESNLKWTVLKWLMNKNKLQRAQREKHCIIYVQVYVW